MFKDAGFDGEIGDLRCCKVIIGAGITKLSTLHPRPTKLAQDVQSKHAFEPKIYNYYSSRTQASSSAPVSIPQHQQKSLSELRKFHLIPRTYSQILNLFFLTVMHTLSFGDSFPVTFRKSALPNFTQNHF